MLLDLKPTCFCLRPVSGATYYTGLLTRRVDLFPVLQGSLTVSQWTHYLTLNLLVWRKIEKKFLPACNLHLPRLSLGWLMCSLYLLSSLPSPCLLQKLVCIGVS